MTGNPCWQVIATGLSPEQFEQFVESVAKEVAPFGTDFLIVEPGPTATNFGHGLDHARPTACYDDTSAGEVGRAVLLAPSQSRAMPSKRSMQC
jgi:NAD(P)-dependent dehydrogenase (short-subunit alcohol dehydrogenase family)